MRHDGGARVTTWQRPWQALPHRPEEFCRCGAPLFRVAKARQDRGKHSGGPGAARVIEGTQVNAWVGVAR